MEEGLSCLTTLLKQSNADVSSEAHSCKHQCLSKPNADYSNFNSFNSAPLCPGSIQSSGTAGTHLLPSQKKKKDPPTHSWTYFLVGYAVSFVGGKQWTPAPSFRQDTPSDWSVSQNNRHTFNTLLRLWNTINTELGLDGPLQPQHFVCQLGNNSLSSKRE